jgi:predicted N-acetyltransferase YhbS
MNLRELKTEDVAAITEVAAQALTLDQVSKELIAEKTAAAPDAFPKLGLVCESDGQVAGFAQGAMGINENDRHRGYVRLLAVAPAFRRRGAGGYLLGALEARLRDHGATEVSVMDVPQNYFMPGLDFRYTAGVCLLLRHGYQMVHENHNMLCAIDEDRWGDLDSQAAGYAPEGIEVRRARPDEWAGIEALLLQQWPAWSDEVGRAFAQAPPAVFLARRAGRVIAFAAYQGNNRTLPWFGPMGTTPECRGKGIGALLLRLCLRELARQGWRRAIIPWVGPICFYARFCDAWLDRCFWVYRKSL